MKNFKFILNYLAPILGLGLILGLANTWLYYAETSLSSGWITTISVVTMVAAVAVLALLTKRSGIKFLQAVYWIVAGDILGVAIMVGILNI